MLIKTICNESRPDINILLCQLIQEKPEFVLIQTSFKSKNTYEIVFQNISLLIKIY